MQDEIKLQEKLFLTLGTKLEHNDYSGFEVEPSGPVANGMPTPKQMFWGAVSRAVRTPSRIDHDLFEPTGFPPTFIWGHSYWPTSISHGQFGF